MPHARWLFPLLLTTALLSLCPITVGALDYENCVIVMFEADV